jgi:menaquinone reductase, iron-sulfur cluster-binding subunit
MAGLAWTMAVDLDRCTGCRACMAACRQENNLAPLPWLKGPARSLDWIRVVRLDNGKAFPDCDQAFMPRLCMHCVDPPCVAACPVGATQASGQGGLVSQTYARCIGCRACQAACPYQARTFNWVDPVWPGSMAQAQAPFVPARQRGVVEKCTFCGHRLFAARDQARKAGRDPAALAEEAYVPACVQVCPAGALAFGDVNNPGHRVARLAASPLAFTLKPWTGAGPRVIYLSARPWLRAWGREARS